MNFSDFNLDTRLLDGTRALAFEAPTPIQEEVIPLILANLDVVGLAQTGTGKTAAFALPLLQALLDQPHDFVQALILTPTRELADQVRKMRAAVARGDRLVPLQVLDFLRTWLAEHIVERDGKYADHFREHGVR